MDSILAMLALADHQAGIGTLQQITGVSRHFADVDDDTGLFGADRKRDARDDRQALIAECAQRRSAFTAEQGLQAV